MGHTACTGHHGKAAQGAGTLGYGPPGLHPGFQGFGLKYHPGYGYGGNALGVGAEGGYPFYGGPGDPQPGPSLRRSKGITPFPYLAGPGYPTPTCPNYFGGIGPLAPDQPVTRFDANPADLGRTGSYGGFDGKIPYPEAAFAPFATVTAAVGTSSRAGSSSPPNAPSNSAPIPGEGVNDYSPVRTLGIELEPVVEPGRARGLKVTIVFPGSAGEKAGLHVDDVILSINGYRTEQLSHLAWISAHAVPDKVLKMSVRTASDGGVHTITGQLP